MEQLALRYEQLIKAYGRLSYMTHKFVKLSQQAKNRTVVGEEEDELIAHRDALIQRFEFCYDLTWKYLRQLLKEKHGIEANSPRKVFQECYAQKILTNDETVQLLEMIDARNETSHVYDENMAERVSQKIVHYSAFLIKLSSEKLS
jgi:nucleotidyltransferase substrate binding protein (TIGR01987 family)